jgi:hypothetical protein
MRNQVETQPAHSLRRKIIRDIIIEWPDPPVPFPKRVPLPAEPPWPLLMAPWRGGFQAMYDPATQMLHWRDYPPTWPYYPVESPYVLMGETFRYDMRAPEVAIKYLLNNLAGTDFPLSAALFGINDTGQTDRNASQRSYNVVNLGPQAPEVVVPQMYQVTSKETLNKYLKSFRDQGAVGAICRGLESGCSDSQFIVTDPL